jgi:hypothetical protein
MSNRTSVVTGDGGTGEILLASGSSTEVVLPGHASSGRLWHFEVEGDKGAISISLRIGPAPKLPPSGGMPPPSYSLDEILVITGIHPGRAELVLTLMRPDEIAPAEVRRIAVRVR